jgi:hypothetical protein
MKARFGGVRAWTLRLAALAVLAVPAAAWAQQGDAPASGQKAWAGDWKVGVDEGQARDEVSGEAMVVAAYGALWLILILFVLRAQALVGGLRRESAELKALVESRFPGADPAKSPPTF